MAERALISNRKERARRREEVPIPEMERRRHDLRPILSARGAQAMVVKRLMREMRMVRAEEDMDTTPFRRETEYIITLFMPQSCWANIIPRTAMIAGR